MSGHWKEIVKIRFDGPRYHGHALDLAALAELKNFQEIIFDTARDLFLAANPTKERTPKGFKDQMRLYLRRIDPGSAVAPLEVYSDSAGQEDMLDEEPVALTQAITLAHQVFEAAANNAPLPSQLSRSRILEYSEWGKSLGEDVKIQVELSGRPPARVDQQARANLRKWQEAAHVASVDLTGEVLEADIKKRRFQLWVDEKNAVSIDFTDDQEQEVTTALKEHKTLRMQVKGVGEISPIGQIKRVLKIDELNLYRAGEVPFDPTARDIVEVLEELAGEIPDEEWDKLPEDLTDHLDHYIYGTPK